MPAVLVIGSQWGDEGKGKVTDILADDMDMVARYQGGNNAGHTVVMGEREFKLHLLPSGVLYPHITPVIGDGVVVDPRYLLEEMAEMRGYPESSVEKLLLSANAHLIMPYHRVFDKATEIQLGDAKIGTTGRGIGPAYADKAARLGLRVQDMTDMKIFRVKLEQALREKNAVLEKVYNLPPLDSNDIADEYEEYCRLLKPYIGDASRAVNEALENGGNVLLEGAQGTMLDIDHGTYPFVTSSSPVAGGACAGVGIGPRWVERVIGIVKAYVTRVGSGPFPTEETGEVGEWLRENGREFGTTTGRARRCGWFDAVILRYAARINGFTGLAVTKLDVLSQFARIKVCVAYEYEGERLDTLPAHQSVFHHCRPVYEELDGWQEDISGVTEFDELPVAARRYVKYLEELGGVPVEMVSVGPSRDQTITLRG